MNTLHPYKFMTNDQINVLFTKVYYGLQHWDYNEESHALTYHDGTTFPIKNWCDNDSIAIELIMNHNISVNREDGESFAFFGEQLSEIYGDVCGYDFVCVDGNIIKALIIVYLMMNS